MTYYTVVLGPEAVEARVFSLETALKEPLPEEIADAAKHKGVLEGEMMNDVTEARLATTEEINELERSGGNFLVIMAPNADTGKPVISRPQKQAMKAKIIRVYNDIERKGVYLYLGDDLTGKEVRQKLDTDFPDAVDLKDGDRVIITIPIDLVEGTIRKL
jgi:hypothetical protein